ncbi:MAG: hypothetical protein AAGB14_05015 [Verrucomicrobiota bacterium]
MEENPYRSPVALDMAEASGTAVQKLRQTLLWHETSIRGLGMLLLIVGIVMIPVSIGTLKMQTGWTWIALGAGVLYTATGIGLRYRTRWAHRLGVVMTIPWLVLFPVGTAFGVYSLWLLLSERGRFVFRGEYEKVIRRTPEISYRTPMISWLAVGVVIVLLIGFVIDALIRS